jgi:hypothetical protein
MAPDSLIKAERMANSGAARAALGWLWESPEANETPCRRQHSFTLPTLF